MITIDEAQLRLGTFFGSGYWIQKPFRSEETNRQMLWQRQILNENTGFEDILRMMEYKDGILLESQTVPARGNYLESLQDLDDWIIDYNENTRR